MLFTNTVCGVRKEFAFICSLAGFVSKVNNNIAAVRTLAKLFTVVDMPDYSVKYRRNYMPDLCFVFSLSVTS